MQNLARILKFHGEVWYNFVVLNFAIPNFANSKTSPLRYRLGMGTNRLAIGINRLTTSIHVLVSALVTII